MVEQRPEKYSCWRANCPGDHTAKHHECEPPSRPKVPNVERFKPEPLSEKQVVWDEADLIDVLPCPFCGCEETLLNEVSCERGDGCMVECENCGAEGPFKMEPVPAQEAWNQRTAVGAGDRDG